MNQNLTKFVERLLCSDNREISNLLFAAQLQLYFSGQSTPTKSGVNVEKYIPAYPVKIGRYLQVFACIAQYLGTNLVSKYSKPKTP